MIVHILVVLILLAFSAFFSASETAFFSLRDSQVAEMKEKGVKNGLLVFNLRGKPERLLSTILIGNNITNITVASYTTFFVVELFGSYGVGIATGVLTIFILIFGEILPKSFALTHNKKIALLFAPLLSVISFVFYPVSVCMQMLSMFVHRASGVKKSHGITEEELRYMMKIGLKGGFIEKGEHELIERVFLFNDIKVGDIMVPLNKVTMFHSNVNMGELIGQTVEHGYARYPIQDNSGSIIGYVTDYDIIRAEHEGKQDVSVSEFVTDIKSVSSATMIDDVCRSMKKSGIHMHLVHDNKDPKKVLGIVTLEDIIEELLGEIVDEEDKRDSLLRKKI